MAAKRINYKQLAARARKDFYNIIAYYPTKRNIDRLEEIFGFREIMRERERSTPGAWGHFADKVVPNAHGDVGKKLAELDKQVERAVELRKDYFAKCVRYHGSDHANPRSQGYADEEDVPGGAVAQRRLTTPECKNHPLKIKRKEVQLEKEKFRKEFYNRILPNAVLKELYTRVFRYGIAYLKKVPILFRRGRGRNWKSPHKNKSLYGWWDRVTEKIYVRTRIKGKPIDENVVYETIMHELMHAYSDSVLYVAKKLKKDFPEPGFEWFHDKLDTIKIIDVASEEFHKKMIKSQLGWLGRGFETLRGAMGGDDAEFNEYIDSASERYARGGSPLLRLYLNRLKGKKGKQLNDDITGDDILRACAHAAYKITRDKDVGSLEFVWKSAACKSFKAQIVAFISQKTGEPWKELTRKERHEYSRKYAKEIKAAVIKKFKDDSDFKQEFVAAAENANRIAKNISRDPQREPRAIAEDKDLKELFKRFL